MTSRPTKELLQLVWDHALVGKTHSWSVLNIALRRALEVAIASGFAMDPKDWADIYSVYRGDYWMSESFEWAYALAIRANNVSAYTSFETWRGREPYIADDVEPQRDYTLLLSRVWSRQRGRLAVGFTFPWKGQQLEVTSFAPDQTYLIACNYHRAGNSTRKIKSRIKITVDGIRADRAARKAAGKAGAA